MTRRTLSLSVCLATLLAVFVVRMCQVPSPLVAQEADPVAVVQKGGPETAKGRGIIVVVDPDATQVNVVKEVVTDLEKDGIVSQRTKQQADVPDKSDQLTITLALKPTVEYKQVEALLVGLKALQTDAPLRLVFKSQTTDKNEARVETGTKVPTTTLQQALDHLIKQSVLPFDAVQGPAPVKSTIPVAGVDSPGAKGTDTNSPAVADISPLRVTLLKIKTEWSDNTGANVLRDELKNALKDQGFAQDILDGLPNSAPGVFFSPQIACVYSPANYAAFRSWLDSHQFVVEATPVTNFTTVSSNKETQTAHGSVDFDAASLGVPLDTRTSHPFVRRERAVQSHLELIRNRTSGMARIGLYLFQGYIEKQLGSTAVRRTAISPPRAALVKLPTKHVAVINAFANDNSELRAAARKQGIEYVLVIENDASLDTIVNPKPRLVVPDQVVTLESSYQNDVEQADVNDVVEPTSSGQDDVGQSIPTTKPPKTDSNKTTKTYELRHIDGATVEEVIFKLLPDLHYSITSVGDRQRVIVRDDAEAIAQFESLMNAIDLPETTEPKSTDGALKSTTRRQALAGPAGIDLTEPVTNITFTDFVPPAGLAALRRQAAKLERRSIDLATEIRQQAAQQEPDNGRNQRLQQNLNTAVKAAFEARQTLLQVEVGELQRRAHNIQVALETRNRVADKIVTKRVADLLNPDFKWDVDESKTLTTPPAETSTVGARTSQPKKTPTPKPNKPTAYPPPADAVIPTPPTKPGPNANSLTPDPYAQQGRSSPASTCVWLEVLQETHGKVLASYLNGTVVSSDGLILSLLRKDDDEQQVLRSVRSVTVITQNKTVTHAHVVAYEPKYGLTLIQTDMEKLPHLPVSKIGLALKQRCVGNYLMNPRADLEDFQATITGLPEATDTNPQPYHAEVSRFGKALMDETLIGSALINGAGELQGVIAQHLVQPVPTDPAAETDAPKSIYAIAPASAVIPLLEKRQVRPQPEPLPSNVSEQIKLHGLLFEMNSQTVDKLFDKLIAVDRATTVMVPADFEQRLKAVGSEGTLDIISRPTIITLLNQTATLQVGASVDRGQPTSKDLPAQNLGTWLEILPTRRIDSSLQLDLSLQIGKQGKAPQGVKAGDIILPATNVQAIRASVVVPADNQVLFVCPSNGPDANRLLFVYLRVESIQANQERIFPSPASAIERFEPQGDPLMRSASEFRKLLKEASEQLSTVQDMANNELTELRKKKASATEADLTKAQPKLAELLTQARQQQQFARDELAAQIKLLTVELNDAKLDLVHAGENEQRLIALRNSAAATALEVAAGKRKLEQAESRLKKAEILLELFMKADPDKKPQDSIGIRN